MFDTAKQPLGIGKNAFASEEYLAPLYLFMEEFFGNYTSVVLQKYLSSWSIYLCIHQFLHIYLSIYLSYTVLSIHLTIYISVYLSINISMFISIYLSVYHFAYK